MARRPSRFGSSDNVLFFKETADWIPASAGMTGFGLTTKLTEKSASFLIIKTAPEGAVLKYKLILDSYLTIVVTSKPTLLAKIPTTIPTAA